MYIAEALQIAFPANAVSAKAFKFQSRCNAELPQCRLNTALNCNTINVRTLFNTVVSHRCECDLVC